VAGGRRRRRAMHHLQGERNDAHPGKNRAPPPVRFAGLEKSIPAGAGADGCLCWPKTLRRVRAWLDPWLSLGRWWRAWSNTPPPTELQALIDAVAAGRPLDLYVRR